MGTRFVKCDKVYLYQHPDNRLETLDPGSVVSLEEDIARQFVEEFGLGEYHSGPESKAGDPGAVERPGLDRRQARAERAVANPQRQ